MDFGDFYQSTSRRTLRYAYGLTGNLQQAQDVTQEAYTRAWQRWRQVSGYDDAEAWLRVVVNRLVQDWWRHLGVRRRIRLEPMLPLPAPSEDTVLLTTALKQLPPAQRQALALHYLLDLSVAQIAAETGVSEGTVKSWLSRGRAGLADSLREEADAAGLRDAGQIAGAGRRRRRTKAIATVTAAGLAVIAVVTLAVAVVRSTRHDQPLNPSPSTTAHTLRRLGEPLPGSRQAAVEATVSGGRFFVAVADAHALTVTALDSATGRRVWQQQVPGRHDSIGGVVASDGFVVVYDAAIADDENGVISNQMNVLDPDTGELWWQREFADPDGNGPGLGEAPMGTAREVALVGEVNSGKLTALNWRTGTVRWTLPGDGSRTIGEVVTREDGYSGFGDSQYDATALTSVLRLSPSGELRRYSLTNGQWTEGWKSVPYSKSTDYLAYGGRLYLRTATQLTTFPLWDNGIGPIVSYTANPVAQGTKETSRLWDLTPCGGDAMCLIDGGNPVEERGRNPYELVAIHAGNTVNRVALDRDTFINTAGPYVLLSSGGLFDSALRQIAPQGQRTAWPVPTGTGQVLLVDRRTTDQGRWEQTALTLFDPVAARATSLGTIAMNPSWLATAPGRLVVETEAGIELYAY
ncbi:RNA polymerase sigma-70 factor (sigma-E family) [Hamadaea flava]|uniref:Sigma-70 family RNA polymerase sigma factor n=1 Tax=Hamadaea flava TaxID=1742688 RepID=A0ABV8LXC6_9ACTN|nr:sigma-70 family RNA polymerase sigma factor [Hamadaea flava]MCP2329092.1 RNA polymerase sigma-70 factor (sigma-E family) [Hamadaea flava]